MQEQFTTSRLLINALQETDAAFMFRLLNSPGWLRFIGNRNIHSEDEARAYVQKINKNPGAWFWVVRLQATQEAAGIFTFIRREHLDHFDIGFAFLPEHGGKGYAYEATQAVLDAILADEAYPKLLAITVKENTRSIKLLKKTGFRFDRETEMNGETLLLFEADADKLRIDRLVAKFFSIFTNTEGRQPDWAMIDRLCLPEAQIIRKAGSTQEIYSLTTFIAPRKKILSDGTLTAFEEKETAEETKIAGGIAQRFAVYEKTGYLNGKPFKANGRKLFQLVKTETGWKIAAVLWEDD